MIVKITYSTELDDVPAEVAKLLSDLTTKIGSLNSTVQSVVQQLSLQKPDLQSASVKLEQTNKFIESIEAKIKDCQSILTGYQNILNPETSQVENKEEEKEKKTVKK